MSRNKSVNEQRTKEALNFYFRKANELGVVNQILQHGGFQLGAIQTSISRGRLSQKMLDSFINVIGANESYLTGREPLPESDENGVQNTLQQIIMTDEQMMVLLNSIRETQDVGNSVKKKIAIDTIKAILNQF